MTRENIEGFDKLSGHTVIFTDASFILTDKGALISYGCMDGGLRYFLKDEAVSLPKVKSQKATDTTQKYF